MTDTTFTIPVTAWSDFVAKIVKLNKRAAKLGCEPITYTKVGKETVERSHTVKTLDSEYTKRFRVEAHVIELHGSAPRLEGFEFIAKIEYLSDGKSTLFHTVPGSDVKIEERFRSLTPSICEHCHKIRSRRETFVVRNTETGVQTQVGRQCLADFTGINSPQQLAARASWLSTYADLREEGERMWGSYLAQTVDTHRALALTSAYIARFGWMPKSACAEGATATMVARHFWFVPAPASGRLTMKAASELAEQPEHQERAQKVVAWIKGELAQKARSDYEMNLVTPVAGELCEHRHLGIVCSAVAAYQRAMNQKVEYAKKQAALQESRHVGVVGERLKDVVARVHHVKMLEAGEWGPRTLVKFVTPTGDLMTWFASSDRVYTPGAEVVLTETIKKHSEYAGIKETQLSRVLVATAAH